MLNLYYDAVELGYRPTYFLRMVNELGGVGAAKRLLGTDDLQAGLTRLWELGRLDLSVEALSSRSHGKTSSAVMSCGRHVNG